MKKITKFDLSNLTFDGIMVGVNNEDKSLTFVVECAYYTKGHHGYPKPGHNPSTSSFFNISYDTKYLPNGLFFNSTSRLPLDPSFFDFLLYDYYKFDDMKEFCTWYLQSIKEEKDWIHEKCNTNTAPKDVPKQPSVGNKNKKYSELDERNTELVYYDIYLDHLTSKDLKKKIEEKYPHFKKEHVCACQQKKKRKEKYKDIILYIDLVLTKQGACNFFTQNYVDLDSYQHTKLKEHICELEKKIEKWLEEEG